MTYYIPVIKKISYSTNVFVERALPKDGEIMVKEGDSVDPITRLGMTKVSYSKVSLGEKLTVVKGKTEDGFFYKGERIGRAGLKYVKAPFNGYLSQEEDNYVFNQEDRDFRLMAGVWGTVHGVVKSRSTLLKTQMIDIPFVYGAGSSTSGEIVVFPNPTEMLELQYLEHYTKGAKGKIIYVGGYASEQFLHEAAKLQVRAVIAGGADKNSYKFAKENNLYLAGLNGFGNLNVTKVVYDFLKEISSRFIFIDAYRNLIRVPVPEDYKFEHKIEHDGKYSNLRRLEPGLQVQIFIKPYFGWFGEVKSVQGTTVYVKLNNADEEVTVGLPNILAIE